MVRLLRKQGAAGEACDRTGPQHQGEPELGHTGATGERLKFTKAKVSKWTDQVVM
jgi:hypothetical protein